MSEVGQRWRTRQPSDHAELDSLVRASIADELVADLFHARAELARDLRENEIAWAAGIFEGEGSWGFYASKLRADIVMGDRDVLERVASALAMGRVVNEPLPANPQHRQMFRLCVTNAQAIELALLLWPYLGERRRSVFREKLALREAFIQEATKERICEGCGETFRPPYSRVASRTKFCSDICGQRHRRRA